MREIKFRAYDEQKEIMHHDFQFIKSGEDSNDWIVFTSDKQKLTHEPHPFENPYFSQQLKVMQWTGIRDEFDVDIYEGDITNEGIVRWFDNLSWDSGGSQHSGFYFEKTWTDKEFPELDYHSHLDSSIRVLGNIYENKDLLK